MAQRYAPYFEPAVFKQQLVPRRIDAVPYHLVGQVGGEVTRVALQYLAHGRRGVYVERRALAVQPECGDERKEPVYVVAVQVRDEHAAQAQRVDPVARQLLLRTLARVDQIVLFVEIDHLRRRVAARRRLGRGVAEYGNRKAQSVNVCIL